MLQQGNNNDAILFRVRNTKNGYGIRKHGTMFEVKIRFSEDIAEFIRTRLTAKELRITNTSNKDCRIVYGHCTPYELDQLVRLKMRGKGNRLISQGLELCKQSGEI